MNALNNLTPFNGISNFIPVNSNGSGFDDNMIAVDKFARDNN
jgi:hypothetical protein